MKELKQNNYYRGTIKQELVISETFKLDIYAGLNKDKIYFIGLRAANGYGVDNSAVTIFDPYELQPVAEFKSPYINTEDLINSIIILIKKYIPKSILVIERNPNGEAALGHIMNSGIDSNIYYEGIISCIQDYYGIWTDVKTRKRMFTLLDIHIDNYENRFVCNNIINDIMNLVRDDHGSIINTGAFHDDSIMSYLLCLYVYYDGTDLNRYGFVRGRYV